MLQQFSELRNMIKFLNERCETAEKQENNDTYQWLIVVFDLLDSVLETSEVLIRASSNKVCQSTVTPTH